MRWRRWISILAAFGVLLHSAAVVRHHAMMVAGVANPAVAALEADLAVICHFNADGLAPVGEKGAPPSDGRKCPLCAGLATAFALPAPMSADIVEPSAVVATYRIWHDQRVAQLKRIRPPGRGPPHLA